MNGFPIVFQSFGQDIMARGVNLWREAGRSAVAAREEFSRRTALARQPAPEGVSGPPLRLVLGEVGAVTRAVSRIPQPRGKAPIQPSTRPRHVMLLPGLCAHPDRMRPIHDALAAAGHTPHDWGLGFNLGANPEHFAYLLNRVGNMARRNGPVALVGWSLGGIYAREIAKHMPDAIDRVITMGSPFSGDRRANNGWRAYQFIAGHPVDEPPIPGDFAVKPPVPTIALWSARDGVVSPRSAAGWPGERDAAMPLRCNHMGFVRKPEAAAAVLAWLEAEV